MEAKVEEPEAQSIKLKSVKRKESIKEEKEEVKIKSKEHEAVEMSFPKRERPELEPVPEKKPAVEEDTIAPEEEPEAYKKPDRRKSSIMIDGKGLEIPKVEVRRKA